LSGQTSGLSGAFLGGDKNSLIIDLEPQVQSGVRVSVPNVFGGANVIAIGKDFVPIEGATTQTRGFAPSVGKFNTRFGGVTSTPEGETGTTPAGGTPTGNNVQGTTTGVSPLTPGFIGPSTVQRTETGIPTVAARSATVRPSFADAVNSFRAQQAQGAAI